ncbi:MAG: enoyl-CoA hydratase/isomerase family protein [Blastocatellia bacterium]|nr:enoyl-CoA hydratase/isomerase family protein [Blastocatellia bacterium]
MEHVRSEREEQLLILTMSRGKANAMNRDMVEELCTSVEQSAADENIRGVVLASGCPRFFSGGFDLDEVFQYDRAAMRDFFGRFIDLYQGLYSLPKPVVAAVSGHAFAGGALLALACDFRVMAEGQFGFAVNEVNLGVVLPPGLIRLILDRVGVGNARRMLLTGEALTPAQALQMGLAAELVEPESVAERARMMARAMAEKPPLAFAGFKRAIGELGGRPPSDDDRLYLDEFIDNWFSAEAEERKRALVESLKR